MKGAEIDELIAAMHSHYEHTKERQAFLELKRDEIRPGDELSLLGFVDAQQELRVEQSLLAGHFHMVQEIIQKKQLKVDAMTTHRLRRIGKYCQGLFL